MLDENIKYKIIKLILKYIATFHTIHESEVVSFFTNDLFSYYNLFFKF